MEMWESRREEGKKERKKSGKQGMVGDANHNPLPKPQPAQCCTLPTQGLWPKRVHFFFGGRRTTEGKYTDKPEAKEALSDTF